VRFLYSKVALLIALQFAYSQAYSQDDDLNEFNWDDVGIEVESGTTQSPNNDSWDFTFNIRSNYDYGDRDANNKAFDLTKRLFSTNLSINLL